MYTTAQSEDLDPDFQASDFKAPMAGFGYGLPLARLVRKWHLTKVKNLKADRCFFLSMAFYCSILGTLVEISS